MRPELLIPLFATTQSLDGVGPRVETLLKKAIRLPQGVTLPRVIDLLWHLPTGVIDRRAEPSIADAVGGTIVTLGVHVLKHYAPPASSKAPYRVACENATGRVDLIFFRAERQFIERQLPVGETRYVSGRVERYNDALQMPHPDYIVAPEKLESLPRLEPVYPLTAGLSGKILLKAIRTALALCPACPEWLDPQLMEREGWPGFLEAVTALHRPGDVLDISTTGRYWQRLAYDELLAGQLTLALVRLNQKSTVGRAIKGNAGIRRKLLAALPFQLTNSQIAALKEIGADMAAPSRMLRLLHGDVGSGKTMVALMTMANAVETGAQAALMAPTEVLARQHLETLSPFATAGGLRLGLLTGREKGRARAKVLAAVQAGEIDILIGTHALFQPDVIFRELAVAVIDEQHRFGVHQRLELQRKGGPLGADVLVMTATPIPRTLLMTQYGDLDVSRLPEKPAGRKPVSTAVIPLERIEEVINGLRRAVSEGAQVYWVCPLVEGSDKSELAAAEERAAYLRQIFGDLVGVVHGQMSGAAKDAAMEAFTQDRVKILVSTTVIEVGVNVPNASIMVIEHAERFGLAQLHQLRGRVGRGARQSSCILLYAQPLGETGKARLEIMRQTEDGFLIAEKDLELRGGGEVLGTRQSGAPEYRVATVPNFVSLIAMARDDAHLILATDPQLQSPRGQALRVLLYLFEQDEAVRLFRAG